MSFAFDRDLFTIISYNGGERVEPPGLDTELVESLAERTGVSVMVYQPPASYGQKRMILNRIYDL